MGKMMEWWWVFSFKCWSMIGRILLALGVYYTDEGRKSLQADVDVNSIAVAMVTSLISDYRTSSTLTRYSWLGKRGTFWMFSVSQKWIVTSSPGKDKAACSEFLWSSTVQILRIIWCWSLFYCKLPSVFVGFTLGFTLVNMNRWNDYSHLHCQHTCG